MDAGAWIVFARETLLDTTLAWRANLFAKRGRGLSGGMTIPTGSVVATKFVNPGDTVRLSMEGLGELNLQAA